jgi:hypothetical protein
MVSRKHDAQFRQAGDENLRLITDTCVADVTLRLTIRRAMAEIDERDAHGAQTMTKRLEGLV